MMTQTANDSTELERSILLNLHINHNAVTCIKSSWLCKQSLFNVGWTDNGKLVDNLQGHIARQDVWNVVWKYDNWQLFFCSSDVCFYCKFYSTLWAEVSVIFPEKSGRGRYFSRKIEGTFGRRDSLKKTFGSIIRKLGLSY